MTKSIPLSLTLVSVIATSAPAAAQSSFASQQQNRSEMQMNVGLVIPLGSFPRQQQSKPRLALQLQRHNYAADWSGYQPRRTLIYQNKLELTLDDNLRFLVNGHHIKNQSGKYGISTGAAVGIGAGLLLGGLLIVAAEGSDNIRGLVRSDQP